MKKNFLIARSNLRRVKGQTAAIIALVLCASVMLNLWLMLSIDYKKNFERCHDRLHAEHVTLGLCSREQGLREYVADALDADGRTEEYTMEDAMIMVGSFPYNGGEVNTEFVILEKQAALDRTIGQVEIVEEGKYDSGVYLPMLYGVDGAIAVGQEIEIIIGSQAVRYTVCGFLNSAMTGSHNCSMSALLLTEDKYRELEDSGIAPASTLVSVRIQDREESEAFEADMKNRISAGYSQVRMLSNSYTQVSSSRYISQMICSGIFSAMAFLVTVIALVVIASNVINYIQENMKNLGVLKAVGYRSGQIILSLQLQFLGVALLTAAAGIALSYSLFPGINDMMISQTGIPYSMHFLPLPCLLVFCAIGGAVALSVWWSSRRIRRIEPIVALRQGVLTHNFKRNHVSLEKARLPLQLALALKTTLSGLMVENVIVDMNPFINLIVGEMADFCVDINPERESELLEFLMGEEHPMEEGHPMGEEHSVRKIYLYTSAEVRHVGGVGLMATMAEDFAQVNNQDVCYQGRFPEYDNEVAIAGKYAREQGLKIGDEITLTAEGREADYLICGFTQISNNLGKDCLLTRAGYGRMGSLGNASYYINLAKGADIDALQEGLAQRFGSDLNATINIRAVLEGSAGIYISLMTVIVTTILALSAAIITFVLYLLVRMMLSNRKRDYGIMKALGCTTGQLILQTAASFLPAVSVSMAVGISVSALIINPLTALFLRGIGIVKCTFTVPVGFIAAAGVGLVAFAFGMSCLLSLRIRKITPVALLAEN